MPTPTPQQVHALADERIRFLGGVWDQDLLDQLYANALTYLHGHSVGGTNPSLLRAIGAGAPTMAFDVGFNREVLGAAGRYFPTRRTCGARSNRLRTTRPRPGPGERLDSSAPLATTGTPWPIGTSNLPAGW